MKIPLEQTISNSKNKLIDIINLQNSVNKKKNALLVAKEWIAETQKNNELILEVKEWINKSSGRGDFILKTKRNRIIFSKTFIGLGCRPYWIVIKELFPWANIYIDKDFYDENLDRSSLDFFLSNHDKIEDDLNDIGIFPYKNGAYEVDFYRLKVTLNDIGKSFLILEDFFAKSDC